ncbi:MAG: CRISPR-associated helicase Cas3' [Thermoflavifilum sp.]|uniref:CRISPR-associated helicase Cas3' n=1 Tax=Thermoflavifilum sp. TaxID=1968839 RepID=UPI0018A470E1|nr:CRISPR-associated helicase Cas3' [Thermoflavifilum sp.]QOR76070.1 MAG: CRISPR-associated helicase Cas3' [Thermoflavifilum sp.]
MEIWAKSSHHAGGQALRLHKHTKDVLEVFEGIQSRLNNKQCVKELIKIAIICHDWGKLLPAFQICTLKNKNYRWEGRLIDYPHSLFSVLWIDEDKLRQEIQKIVDCNSSDVNMYYRFVISAIAYHHWRESFFDLISYPSDELKDLLDDLSNKKNDLTKSLEEEVTEVDPAYTNLVGFNQAMAEGLKNDVPFSAYAVPPYLMYFLPYRTDIELEKLRNWILVSGFLQRCDHFASFCESEHKALHAEINPVHDLSKVKESIKNKIGISNESDIWQFKYLDSTQNDNVILIAPTGYGKTEFAFLWGWGSERKFFYTLPLRAAVNQMYNRAKRIFSDDQVGLLHSDADVFLFNDGGERQDNMRSYDLARQLSFPAMVSTGDQFFPYALRPPGYERIFSVFSYSRLVVDEVQAYNPKAAAIVVKFIEDVLSMGGKFLLMTATLPEFIKQEIIKIRKIYDQGYCQEEEKGIINIYQNEKDKFENLKKHILQIKCLDPSNKKGNTLIPIPHDELKHIWQLANEKKRVLVIVNTVSQAQDVYNSLKKLKNEMSDDPGIDITLLHAQFTLNDRREKEVEIEKKFKNPKPEDEEQGKILVATQVVEASLDIDADVLFTELAPLDALVQRMGRVLRRYGPNNPPPEKNSSDEPNVYIWVFNNKLQSINYRMYDKDILFLSLKILHIKSKNRQSSHTKDQKNSDGVIFRELKNSKPFAISEYDKYELVCRLYSKDNLSDDSDYILCFTKTLDILRAGYMSDRKIDAQKLFRDIQDVPVIPECNLDNVINTIRNFLSGNEENYTRFKHDVLSEFVVHIRLYYVKEYLHPHHEVFNRIAPRLEDEGIDKSHLLSLKKWLNHIFVVPVDYNRELGVLFKKQQEIDYIL